MDVESFSESFPSSQKKVPSITVHQAEAALRLGFLRKVYGILTVQLLVTVIVCVFCMAVPAIRSFVHGNPFVFIGVFVGTLVSLFGLFIKRYDTPTNFYLLAIFTLLQSISVGSIVTYYDQMIVLKAFVITTAVFISLTLYTMQSKYDYSTWGASLFSFLWILIIAGILQMFFWSEAFHFVLSVGGAIIFCGFILYDTYMIMHKVSTEDYIIAAVDLYLDFINLFIHMLRILNEMKSR